MSSKLGKGAKLSAKRREEFLKMTAGRNITQLDTERAAAHLVESTGSTSIPPPTTSDEQVTLNTIKDMLLELTEKVNRMERKISEMDKRMIEGLNLSNETKYIKIQLKEAAEEYLIENESDFYESMEDIQWNVFYEDKLAKP
ncbi:13252_t:CDS:2, partial [Ambispora leptoticha]